MRAFSQAGIGGLYAGGALVNAVAATLSARFRPRAVLAVSVAVGVAGLALAGATTAAALSVVCVLAVAAADGGGNTASIGVLLETVGVQRIVLAMVVWSQFSVVGYLAGPLVSGPVAEVLGFGALGLGPLAAALVVAVAYLPSGRRSEAAGAS